MRMNTLKAISDEERHIGSHVAEWSAALGFAHTQRLRRNKKCRYSIAHCRNQIWRAVPRSDATVVIKALKSGWPTIPGDVVMECLLPIRLLEELDMEAAMSSCRWVAIETICSNDIERAAFRTLAPDFVRRHPDPKPERYVPIFADPDERVCRVCGCTDNFACVDDNGQPCSWVAAELCSHCQ